VPLGEQKKEHLGGSKTTQQKKRGTVKYDASSLSLTNALSANFVITES
jgi:hypothetical protein